MSTDTPNETNDQSIRLTIEEGEMFLYFSQDCFIHSINEWYQFYSGHGFNWYTFTFFKLEIEKDGMFPGFELTFMLLGLGLRFRMNFTEDEKYKEVMERAKDVTKEKDV